MRPKLIIIGGGVAGLSAAIHAQRNGWHGIILEHNEELGGVCTSWKRGSYAVDSGIQWLMGSSGEGDFAPVLREVGISPQVPMRPLTHFCDFVDEAEAWRVSVTSDLEKLRADLAERSLSDARAVDELIDGALALEHFHSTVEPTGGVGAVKDLWAHRKELMVVMRHSASAEEWARNHFVDPALVRLFAQLTLPEAPMYFQLALLAQLATGQLALPVGGAGAVREALLATFKAEGGEARLKCTVEEILVEEGRAVGVRLADGTQVHGDAVLSTSSAYETHERLLGGRYMDTGLRRKLDRWKPFPPLLMASFGVNRTWENLPPSMHIALEGKLDTGGHASDHFLVRFLGAADGACPEGHTLVQLFIDTDWGWWAERGDHYEADKDAVARRLLHRLERHLPGVEAAVDMVDVCTPLTFWRHARSWRGAFEGWLPTSEAFTAAPVRKVLGLDGMYLAGQWVSAGGGVPPSILSGREAVRALCSDMGLEFKH